MGSRPPKIMIFHPSYTEFVDFTSYIKYMESCGAHKAGIAKVVPPKEYVPSKEGYESVKDMLIPAPYEQVKNGLDGLFNQKSNPRPNKSMTVREFEQYSAIRHPTPNHYDYGDLERKFWNSLTRSTPLYGADVSGTVTDFDLEVWNINKLGSILDLTKIQMEGINTPMLYFGAWKTAFCFHTEDMDLYSINYLHYGMPKTWYAIPPSYGRRFERVAQGLFPTEFKACPAFLRHKETLISPMKLMQYSIPHDKITQEPGEFIITFPYGYHSGFNHGKNCAESTNFAMPRWVEYGKRTSSCFCNNDPVRIDMKTFVKRFQPERYKRWLIGQDYGRHPEDPNGPEDRCGKDFEKTGKNITYLWGFITVLSSDEEEEIPVVDADADYENGLINSQMNSSYTEIPYQTKYNKLHTVKPGLHNFNDSVDSGRDGWEKMGSGEATKFSGSNDQTRIDVTIGDAVVNSPREQKQERPAWVITSKIGENYTENSTSSTSATASTSDNREREKGKPKKDIMSALLAYENDEAQKPGILGSNESDSDEEPDTIPILFLSNEVSPVKEARRRPKLPQESAVNLTFLPISVQESSSSVIKLAPNLLKHPSTSKSTNSVSKNGPALSLTVQEALIPNPVPVLDSSSTETTKESFVSLLELTHVVTSTQIPLFAVAKTQDTERPQNRETLSSSYVQKSSLIPSTSVSDLLKAVSGLAPTIQEAQKKMSYASVLELRPTFTSSIPLTVVITKQSITSANQRTHKKQSIARLSTKKNLSLSSAIPTIEIFPNKCQKESSSIQFLSFSAPPSKNNYTNSPPPPRRNPRVQQNLHEETLQINKLTCTVCGQKFTTRSNTTRHITSHFMNNKSNRIRCRIGSCKYTTTTRSNLLLHKREKH